VVIGPERDFLRCLLGPEIAMALKPSTAKITDFETSFDAVPVTSPEGDVIWADIRIDYILSGLTPTVIIRVPVPWNELDTSEERKSKALRCARQLIDHACRAAGVGAETEIDDTPAEEVLDAVMPTALEGIGQELGLAKPTAKPRRQRATKADA
jgi:hypothetical protein